MRRGLLIVVQLFGITATHPQTSTISKAAILRILETAKDINDNGEITGRAIDPVTVRERRIWRCPFRSKTNKRNNACRMSTCNRRPAFAFSLARRS